LNLYFYNVVIFKVTKSLISKTKTLFVNESDPIKIDCDLNDLNDIRDVKWTLNDSKIDLKLKHILENRNTSLTIANIEAKESGVYECYVKTKDKNYLTKTIVSVNPRQTSVKFNTRKIKSLKDKSIILDCTFGFNNQNFLSISYKQNLIEWNLNDLPLDTEKNRNKYER
jgi:hypothetical protein